MTDRRRVYGYVGVAVAAVVVVAVAVILVSRPAALAPPAQTVQSLLELRSDNATDVAGYARYIESTQAASTLAEDAASRKAGDSAIPEWETPLVTKETSTTAEVSVKWRSSDKFADWPASTVFMLELRGGRWVLVDAQASQPGSSESTSAAPSESEEATSPAAP